MNREKKDVKQTACLLLSLVFLGQIHYSPSWLSFPHSWLDVTHGWTCSSSTLFFLFYIFIHVFSSGHFVSLWETRSNFKERHDFCMGFSCMEDRETWPPNENSKFLHTSLASFCRIFCLRTLPSCLKINEKDQKSLLLAKNLMCVLRYSVSFLEGTLYFPHSLVSKCHFS